MHQVNALHRHLLSQTVCRQVAQLGSCRAAIGINHKYHIGGVQTQVIEPELKCVPFATQLGVVANQHLNAHTTRNVGCAIRAVICHHQQFDVGISTSQQACQRVSQSGFFVVSWNQHSHTGINGQHRCCHGLCQLWPGPCPPNLKKKHGHRNGADSQNEPENPSHPRAHHGVASLAGIRLVCRFEMVWN